MTTQKQLETRDQFEYFLAVPTRWMDNDVYGHVNNVVYYSYFDTVINEYLIREGGLDPAAGGVIGLCVESMCRFHQELSFPEVVDAGLRVGKIGSSSVRYEIGLFKVEQRLVAAAGYFVHVFVDRRTKRPASIPQPLRSAVERLVRPS